MATSIKRSKGSQSSLRIGTFSFWIKFTTVGGFNVYSNTVENDNNRGYLSFTSTAQYRMVDNDSSGTHIQLRTTRKFRDFNAWYHVVVRIDTTQTTSTDRVRIYVNGVQETSFDQTDYPAQNDDLKIFQGGQTNREYMNNIYGGSASSPNFYLSHFHYADGQSYGPDTFGSTDATTGEWKINTNPTVTYGNQGFFMFKDDASLNDDSGNSNNWSSDSGTIQKSEDNPSNVFATLDKLQYKTSALTYSNGNTTVSFPGAWVFALGQWGVSKGKFYWEAKCNSGNNANSYFGICAEMVPAGNGFYNNSQNGAIMYKVGGGETYIDGSYNSSGYSPSINNTDIVGLALDLDSGTKTLKIYKNGSLLSSGGTINLSSYYDDTLVFPCFSGNSSSASCSFDVNFGNGYFGTTAVSSAGSNASNFGIFEYDVPSGYTALCTKGLNE